MKISSGRLYFILPLLYMGIFALLLVIQFSRNEFFTQSLGELTISGRRPVRTAQAQEEVVDLQVSAISVLFPFSSARPLVLETTDGTLYRLRAESWTMETSRILVRFQRGIQVAFSLAQGGKSVQVIPLLPKDLRDVRRVGLAFEPPEAANWEPDSQLPIVKVIHQGKPYFLSLSGTQDGIEEDHFNFYYRSGEFRGLVIENSKATTTFDYWMSKQTGTAGIAAYRKKLEEYWNEAWRGWNQTRILQEQGLWRFGTGLPRFSESVVLAYLNTAADKGVLPTALPRVATGAVQNPSQWTFDTQPFLGNLMETTAQFRRSFTNLEETLNSRNLVVLDGRFNLAQEAYYMGSDTLYPALEKWFLTVDPKELSLREASYLLANLQALALFRPDKRFDERLMTIANTKILPSINRGSWGTLLENERGFLDTLSTLISGLTLVRQGQSLKDDRLTTLGRSLVLSALNLKVEAGGLPEIILLEKGQIRRTEGLVFPEQLYPLQELEKIQAQWISLSKNWARKGLLRTVAKVEILGIDSTQASFRFTFPPGQAHHLILQGVEPFNHITLHNNRWRTDSSFQSYSDGWFYSASTKTLFVKITHKQAQVDFVIHYVSDPPAATGDTP